MQIELLCSTAARHLLGEVAKSYLKPSVKMIARAMDEAQCKGDQAASNDFLGVLVIRNEPPPGKSGRQLSSQLPC